NAPRAPPEPERFYCGGSPAATPACKNVHRSGGAAPSPRSLRSRGHEKLPLTRCARSRRTALASLARTPSAPPHNTAEALAHFVRSPFIHQASTATIGCRTAAARRPPTAPQPPPRRLSND